MNPVGFEALIQGMNIIKAPINKVIPWDKNPRGIKTKDYERLKKQILKLGVYKPLLAYKQGDKYVVLGGNMRIRALKEMGLKEVDISVVEPTSEAQKIEFALSDNDRAGYYEEDKLAELVYPEIKNLDLGEFKVDLGEAIDLQQVVERYGPDIDDGADDMPEIDDTPAITKAGDLFTLGRHRLLCGDSTKAEDVGWLMDGKKADMVFTDPPYGMDVDTDYSKMAGGERKGKTWDRVIGDDKDFDPTSIFEAFGYCEEMFLWGADYYFDRIPNWKDGALIVWDKTLSSNQDAGYNSEFELLWSKKPHKREILRFNWFRFFGLQNQDVKTRQHPTQKPLQVIFPILSKYGKEGQIVVDTFLGSGTTLIAAEKLNRICYGMEIDQKYCDVIIKRYCDYTGADESAVRATVN